MPGGLGVQYLSTGRTGLRTTVVADHRMANTGPEVSKFEPIYTKRGWGVFRQETIDYNDATVSRGETSGF